MNKTKADEIMKEISSFLTKKYHIFVKELTYNYRPDVHYAVIVYRRNRVRISPSIEQKIKSVVSKSKMLRARNTRANSITIKEVYI